jgi:PAS domain-containing protein
MVVASLILTIEQHAKTIGILAGALSGVLLLWRWLGSPLLKVGIAARKRSHQISAGLPPLLDLASQYSAYGRKLTDVVSGLEDEAVFSRSRIHSIIDALHIAAAETDAQGKVTWVSEAWCDLANLSMQEARGNGWAAGATAYCLGTGVRNTWRRDDMRIL